jgi:hypothetical protein
MTSAIDKALAHIEDAFRQERKDKLSIMADGHRVKFLVDRGRFGFREACREAGVDATKIKEAFDWFVDDNARLNPTHNSNVHKMDLCDYTVVGWFQEQEEATRRDNVTSMVAA